MFTIRASYQDKFEIKTNLEKTRAFFANIKNFVELMPNIESIRTDGKGITRWTICAEIPIVGAMRESFAVKLSENERDRIEWTPDASEKNNFLRYAADFIEAAADLTTVQVSQQVELRRPSARDFHPLANLAGENRISLEMSRRVAEMIKTFMRKSGEILER